MNLRKNKVSFVLTQHANISTNATEKKERIFIIKNVVTIAIGFMTSFMAYFGLNRLQSTLHDDDGLGVITHAILYFCMIGSSLVLPKIFITVFGLKWSMSVCILGHIIWIVSNG